MSRQPIRFMVHLVEVRILGQEVQEVFREEKKGQLRVHYGEEHKKRKRNKGCRKLQLMRGWRIVGKILKPK